MIRPIVIFDIDGTLADCANRRGQLALTGDMGKFLNEVSEDLPNYPVVDLYKTLQASGKYAMFIVSGRKEGLYIETVNWLAKYGIFYDSLLLRKNNDNRMDADVKREMLKEHFSKDRILFVVDDRQQVVDMWRSLGITCLQCADFKG